MQSYQVDPVSGARLVGGEMLQWSDLDKGVSPGVSGLLLTHVRQGRPAPGRVLVLGPRAAQVFEQVAPHAEVDVLVRGLPDARALSSVGQMRQDVTVYCGSLERFEPTAPYDLIVVLDSPSGLSSPDSEGIGQREVLQRLSKWLSPEGTLVAVVENDLGFDRLFRLQVRERYDDDLAWDRGAPGLDPRPLYHRELREVLPSVGLRADEVYAAFPSASDVALLVGSACVEDPALARAAAGQAAQVLTDHFSREPALVDPYDMALRLLESGEVMALASAWLLVAGPASRPETEVGDPLAVLSTDRRGRPEWRALRSVEREDGRWVQRLRPLVPAAEVRGRRVVRRYEHLSGAGAELSTGTTLEAALRRASERHDVAQVRTLLRRYAAFLASLAGTPDAEVGFFAVPANVVLDGEQLRVLDDTWRFAQALPPQVVLLRGLRDFARRLLRSGVEHPWAPDSSPDRLAQTLAGMTGTEVTERDIDAVARYEAEVDVVLDGGGSAAESMSYARNLDSGRSQFVSQSGPARSYREVTATTGRLAQELDARHNQVEWLELTLRLRDRRLGDLEHQLRSTRDSASFKIGRFFTWPLRSSVSLVRRVVLSAIPPGYLRRGLELAKRLSRSKEQ